MKRARNLQDKQKQNIEMYRLYKEGKMSTYDLAIKYGITQPRAWQIITKLEQERRFSRKGKAL